jgi:hypothetical protein
MVPGLVCACVRGVPFDAFGPGVSSVGSIGCTEQGLTDVSYRLIQDHNTTPGDRQNRIQGMPDDPECDNSTTLPGGTVSNACLEGSGELCSDPEDIHRGVCRSPRQLTRFGGEAGRGSAFILNNISISLLRDGGRCSTNGAPPGRPCPFPEYGPDCQPCTPDDSVFAAAENIPLTTGSSEGAVFDANNNSTPSPGNPPPPTIIDFDQSCFGTPCLTRNVGSNFDCDLLAAQPTGGLSGGSLAVTFPGIDAATIGDNVTGTVFFNQ